jgi:hypothetical protein
MPSNEVYYLLMVCVASLVFAVVLGGSYIQYRRWLKQHPHAADD